MYGVNITIPIYEWQRRCKRTTIVTDVFHNLLFAMPDMEVISLNSDMGVINLTLTLPFYSQSTKKRGEGMNKEHNFDYFRPSVDAW